MIEQTKVYYTDEDGIEREVPVVDGVAHMPKHGGPLNFRIALVDADGVERPAESVAGGGGRGTAGPVTFIPGGGNGPSNGAAPPTTLDGCIIIGGGGGRPPVGEDGSS